MNLTVNTTAGDVNAFDASAMNATGAMSAAMKTYYDTELLESSRRLVGVETTAPEESRVSA